MTQKQAELKKDVSISTNIIKKSDYIPPDYEYQMDYRYWTKQFTLDFMFKNGLSKKWNILLKEIDGKKLVNFDPSKFKEIKGETLDKIKSISTTAKREFAATVFTRAARLAQCKKLNKCLPIEQWLHKNCYQLKIHM